MNSMIQLFSEISTPDDGSKIVKVPEYIYQQMYHIAQLPNSVKENQELVFNALIRFVDEVYTGYGLQNFIDLSDREAQAINTKIASRMIGGPLEKMKDDVLMVSWGMYILLQYGAPHISPSGKSIENTKWNAADKSDNIRLSNNDLTAKGIE